MKKVLLITNIPTHYKVALLNHVDSQLKEQGTVLRVKFVALSAPSRQGRIGWSRSVEDATFNWACLSKIRIRSFDLIRNLGSVIDEEAPDLVIISGNTNLYALQISRATQARNIPYLLYSGVPGDQRGLMKTGFLIKKVRRTMRKYLFNKSCGIIAHGKTHADYALSLIKNKELPVTIAYNTVDLQQYFKQENPVNPKVAEIVRNANSNCNIIYCGKLIHRKGLDLLLHAIAKIKDLDFKLHILGSGNQKDYLQKLTREYGLDDKVAFISQVAPAEVPSYYFSSDFFVLPTRYDIWGLVINEAMAASLPVISSKYAVAANELIRDHMNGFVIDPDDTNEFAEKMKLLIEDKDLRNKMGQNAFMFAKQNLLISDSAKQVVKSINIALHESNNEK